MSYIEKEKLIKADMDSIENRVRHAFNQGYDLGFKDGKSKQPNCSEIPTGSTDCISRQAVIDLMMQKWGENFSGDDAMQESIDAIRNMPSVTPQEPFKPMVEIDLDYVIKQKYIEREVLDKIRGQIKDYLRGVEITLEVLVENDPLRPKMEGAKDTLEECLDLIDKAESEDKE